MLNPVLRRELLSLLRSKRSFAAISIYVVLLVALEALFHSIIMMSSGYSGYDPSSSLTLYQILFGIQLGFIVLVVPSLAGGAISAERERQTLDLLLITKMSSMDIIVGKLSSSLVLVALMIAASMPVFGILMYYGGIGFLEVLVMVLFSLVSAAFVASIAIFYSTIIKRTVFATILTLLTVIMLGLGTLMAVVMFSAIFEYVFNQNGLSAETMYAVLCFNPFIGFMSVIDTQTGYTNVIDMVNSMGSTSMSREILPLWVFNVAIQIAAAVGLTFAAAHFVQPVRTKKVPNERTA